MKIYQLESTFLVLQLLTSLIIFPLCLLYIYEFIKVELICLSSKNKKKESKTGAPQKWEELEHDYKVKNRIQRIPYLLEFASISSEIWRISFEDMY